MSKEVLLLKIINRSFYNGNTFIEQEYFEFMTELYENYSMSNTLLRSNHIIITLRVIEDYLKVQTELIQKYEKFSKSKHHESMKDIAVEIISIKIFKSINLNGNNEDIIKFIPTCFTDYINLNNKYDHEMRSIIATAIFYFILSKSIEGININNKLKSIIEVYFDYKKLFSGKSNDEIEIIKEEIEVLIINFIICNSSISRDYHYITYFLAIFWKEEDIKYILQLGEKGKMNSALYNIDTKLDMNMVSSLIYNFQILFPKFLDKFNLINLIYDVKYYLFLITYLYS